MTIALQELSQLSFPPDYGDQRDSVTVPVILSGSFGLKSGKKTGSAIRS